MHRRFAIFSALGGNAVPGSSNGASISFGKDRSVSICHARTC